jgi:hypothetical protein
MPSCDTTEGRKCTARWYLALRRLRGGGGSKMPSCDTTEGRKCTARWYLALWWLRGEGEARCHLAIQRKGGNVSQDGILRSGGCGGRGRQDAILRYNGRAEVYRKMVSCALVAAGGRGRQDAILRYNGRAEMYRKMVSCALVAAGGGGGKMPSCDTTEGRKCTARWYLALWWLRGEGEARCHLAIQRKGGNVPQDGILRSGGCGGRGRQDAILRYNGGGEMYRKMVSCALGAVGEGEARCHLAVQRKGGNVPQDGILRSGGCGGGGGKMPSCDTTEGERCTARWYLALWWFSTFVMAGPGGTPGPASRETNA